MFVSVAHASKLPEQRLRLIYEGDGLGGEKTMRAKVIRELIDEIRALRQALRQTTQEADGHGQHPHHHVADSIDP